jgi:2-haloacid dehalogenase
VVSGLRRLRQGYIIASLSNGNVALLVNMAKRAGLPWDCVLSSELARHYKPDPAVYQTAADLLGLQPSEVMMVAAHNGDLLAARGLGFQTAFVLRALEYGPGQTTNLKADPAIDVVATDLGDLADKLLGATQQQ